MRHTSNIELQYTTALVELLRLGDKEVLKSHHWDKGEFEKRIIDISAFFPELRDHNVLIYLTHHRAKTLASMHPPFFPIGDGADIYLGKLRKMRPEIFIINFSRDIFSLDEIAQVLNYSHEFQHVVQYITNKRCYFLSRIMARLVVSMHEEDLPTEIDTDRASKRILETIYGKRKVDDWINQRLDEDPHSFFIRFGKLDIDAEYDIKQRTMQLWEENHLDEEIERIRNKKRQSKDEQRILKMYDEAMTERGK